MIQISFLNLSKFVFCVLQSESEGADRVLFTALSPDVEEFNGNYFENCRVSKPISLVRNRDTQEKLWDISCQLLDIHQFGAK